MWSLVKLVPNSAGCQGRGAKTLESFTLAFQFLPEDWPGSPCCWGTALLEQTWTHLWLWH